MGLGDVTVSGQASIRGEGWGWRSNGRTPTSRPSSTSATNAPQCEWVRWLVRGMRARIAGLAGLFTRCQRPRPRLRRAGDAARVWLTGIPYIFHYVLLDR